MASTKRIKKKRRCGLTRVVKYMVARLFSLFSYIIFSSSFVIVFFLLLLFLRCVGGPEDSYRTLFHWKDDETRDEEKGDLCSVCVIYNFYTNTHTTVTTGMMSENSRRQ